MSQSPLKTAGEYGTAVEEPEISEDTHAEIRLTVLMKTSVQYKARHFHAASRAMRCLFRLAELCAVLALIVAGTLLHLLFGWIIPVIAFYSKSKPIKTAYAPRRQ